MSLARSTAFYRLCLSATMPLFLTLAIACSDSGGSSAGPGGWGHSLTDEGSVLINHDGVTLFELADVESLDFSAAVTMSLGFFEFAKLDESETGLTFAAGEGGIVAQSEAGEPAATLSFEVTEGGNYRGTLTGVAGVSALRLQFVCGEDDRFWGFGEQYNYVDLRGYALPIWVQEQGVGRIDGSQGVGIGDYFDSYFPMPYFIDPAAGKGFMIENSEFSRFDLCAADSDRWSAEIWNGESVSFVVLAGPKPADVVTQLTAEVGRPSAPPPDWAFTGVWLAAQGGSDQVRERLVTAQEAGVPVSAMWVQDWVGIREFVSGSFGVKYHWIWEQALYPDLPEMISDFEGRGVRFLGYFNPFVVQEFEHYDECDANGYLPQTADGQSYGTQVVVSSGSMIDPTDSAAVEYFQGFAQTAVDMGMKGWMADFGEWLPFDSEVEAGPGASRHNLYPTDWHRINREVLDDAYPDGDYVMLTRSGFTYEQQVAQIVWAGDQEAKYDEGDGISTVIPAALNMGLSGVPYFTHDLGGFSGGPRTKSIFLRWTELGAFTPFMRTHDGLKKFENHHFDGDEETLAFFSRFARIHKALAPYFIALAAESVESGLPLIRHTVLVDPDWEPAFEAHGQWMIGPDLLFAPVVADAANTVEVSFPEGDWVHLLTGESYDGRTVTELSAPVGTPAVFVRSGTLDDIAEVVRVIE